MAKARFPKSIAVSELTEGGFVYEGDPRKPEKMEESLEDGAAVAIYKLEHVYTYRTRPYLDRNE